MTYNISRDGGNDIIVPDYTVNSETSLELLGRGTINYGSIMAANLMKLMQNFSSPTEPVNPSLGQIWFRNTSKSLLVCKNAGGANFADRWDEIVSASQNGLSPFESWSIENLKYIVQLQNINPDTQQYSQVAAAILAMVARGVEESWDHRNIAYLVANQGISQDSSAFDQVTSAIRALATNITNESWASKSLQTLVVNEGLTFNATNYNQVPNSVGLIALRSINQSWGIKNLERLLANNSIARNDANTDQILLAVSMQANTQIAGSWIQRNLSHLLVNNGAANVVFNNASNDQVTTALNRLIGWHIGKEATDRDLADQRLDLSIVKESNARSESASYLNNEIIKTNNSLAELARVRSETDDSLQRQIDAKVNKSGDTMYGDLHIQKVGAGIALSGSARSFGIVSDGDGHMRINNRSDSIEIIRFQSDNSVHIPNGGVHALPGNSYQGQKGVAMVNPDYRIGRWLWNVAGYFEVAIDNTLVRVDVSASDERLKERIAPADINVRELIRRVGFINYAMKRSEADIEASGPSPLLMGGVSAQQGREVCPQWISEMSDGSLMLNTSIMLTNALKLCQELDAEVTALSSGLSTSLIWERTTDAEAEVLDGLLAEQPVRVRKIFGGARIDPKSSVFTDLKAAMVKAFGKTRTNAILAV